MVSRAFKLVHLFLSVHSITIAPSFYHVGCCNLVHAGSVEEDLREGEARGSAYDYADVCLRWCESEGVASACSVGLRSACNVHITATHKLLHFHGCGTAVEQCQIVFQSVLFACVGCKITSHGCRGTRSNSHQTVVSAAVIYGSGSGAPRVWLPADGGWRVGNHG